MWVCYGTSTAASYWQILTFAYLAVLQVVGIVLAFQTRNVKIKALRDSKLIASVIYISSLVLVFLGVSTFALRTYINARGAVFANGIFVLTTIFLALLFIPKVRWVHASKPHVLFSRACLLCEHPQSRRRSNSPRLPWHHVENSLETWGQS